jgi:ectoine hydroxylase-related dioxygenase (phytanoyl-CoA dioxygenase family)
MYLSYKDALNYQRDGYVLVENLFSKVEVRRLLDEIESGDRVNTKQNNTVDSKGMNAKLAIWHELGNDIWANASTSPRIVNNIRILLGEEAAFFHGKVMLKEAKTGGAWEWHQDYGYWYNQGFLFPHMISAFVALDQANVQNGCLKVLKGSHMLGRLEHGIVGSQTGADPSRIQQLENLFELVECEMTPGSVLFFHSNLLHSSGPNESDYHRRSFIICYNALHNPQLVKGEIVTRMPCPVGSDNALAI